MNTAARTKPRSLGAQSDSLLSWPLVTIAATSLSAGIVVGGLAYLDRSPQRAPYVGGTAAWAPHIALLLLTAVGVTVMVRRRGADAVLLMLLAPLGPTAARRLANTVASILRHPTALLRLLLGVLPLAMLVFGPFRVGVQILGGLDPNFTVNAWGGPTYLGAMACHYLDAVLLMAAAAALLNKLLLPAAHGTRR
ncbi:hypothetical protein [Nocardia altamirensis]|uniref:hypothetical protein n=1 Tax=Nocardia altamirensis TaxID=472158 RepID=UPI0009FDD2A2|nr:hypothetical protein [Nocardia altamirensis]